MDLQKLPHQSKYVTSNDNIKIDTGVQLATMPLSWRHYWIVFVSSLGQLIGTGVATLAGILISMLQIVTHPELSAFSQGVIGSSDLLGIVIGSVLFGRLCDKYGYLLFFRLCPALMLVASLISLLYPNVVVVTICLFVIGLGIGGEYSLDSNYISELLPVKWRSFMIGVAKTASAVGNIGVAGVCYLMIRQSMNGDMWYELMWIIVVIAAIMLICRIKFYQSPNWLIGKGEYAKAEKAAQEFLGKNVRIEKGSNSQDKTPEDAPNKVSMIGFIKNNLSQIILSGVPWACEGLGVYGIGVFLPILIMALGIGHQNPDAAPIVHVLSSVEVTFLISCVILPGFILGIYLIQKKKSLISIQFVGFLGCAISLILLLIAYKFHFPPYLAIIFFMSFEVFLNMGPHLITYVLPPKIFPVAVRGMGSGIAASIGKIGAVIAVFIIPLCLSWGGSELVLIVSICVMLIGALVTGIYGKRFPLID